MNYLRRSRLFRHLLFFLKNLFASDLTLYASSLSFYTLFIIFPLLLIILTILTKMPNFYDYYEEIKNVITGNLLPIYTDRVTNYIDAFLKNSRSLGIFGFIMTTLSSFLFFNNLTLIINRIFKLHPQKFTTNFIHYALFMLFSPLLLTLFFYISHKMHLREFAPFMVMWLFFILLYKISINKKIRKTALFASTYLTTLAITISKQIFIFYVFYNDIYRTLYGSFSIAIFFFLWIYISWVLVIYGFKLAYLIDRLRK